MNCPPSSVIPASLFFSTISRLSLLLLHLVLYGLVVSPALAVEQNTTFLPAKINSSDNISALTTQVDQAMATALSSQGFSMLERSQATQLLNYQGSWPPAVTELQALSQKTGHDYVAVGSVTAIGEQISIDYKVYDLLEGSAPQSYYRQGESLSNLASIMAEISTEMIRFTNREQVIASIEPEGNKRIDTGAINRKIQSKPGDISVSYTHLTLPTTPYV